MTDEFIDGEGLDIFDPQVALAAEDKLYETRKMNDAAVEAHIRKVRHAYGAVFNGKADAADVKVVLDDMAWFCKAYANTFDPLHPKLQDFNEGRRSVYLRIMEMTRLGHDAYLQKYLETDSKGN